MTRLLPRQRAQSESLEPEDRLRRRADYLECYRRGWRIGGRHATLFVLPNRVGRPRLGITASGKLGSAVVRNRLRRRGREIFRRWQRRGELPALDIVMNFKYRAVHADYEATRSSLEHQLEKVLEHC